MSEEYIKPGRVLIAAQMVFVPIYFFVLANAFPPIQLPLLPILLSEVLGRLISPIVLSLPFVLFSYFQRYEVSEAYEHMGDQILHLPNSIKAFYGFNFLLVVLFGLPFVAPLIALSGGYFIGLVIKGKREDVVQISRPFIKMTTVLWLPFAFLIAVVFYFQIYDFFMDLVDLWVQNIDFIYFSSLNLANGALLGGVLIFLFDYMENVDYTYERPQYVELVVAGATFVVLELVLVYFVFFTPEGITGTHRLIFSFVNIGGFLLSVGLVVVRWFFRYEDDEEGTSLWGWLTIFAFQVVNLASSSEVAVLSRSSAIGITCIIFIVLFITSYRAASKYV